MFRDQEVNVSVLSPPSLAAGLCVAVLRALLSLEGTHRWVTTTAWVYLPPSALSDVFFCRSWILGKSCCYGAVPGEGVILVPRPAWLWSSEPRQWLVMKSGELQAEKVLVYPGMCLGEALSSVPSLLSPWSLRWSWGCLWAGWMTWNSCLGLDELGLVLYSGVLCLLPECALACALTGVRIVQRAVWRSGSGEYWKDKTCHGNYELVPETFLEEPCSANQGRQIPCCSWEGKIEHLSFCLWFPLPCVINVGQAAA